VRCTISKSETGLSPKLLTLVGIVSDGLSFEDILFTGFTGPLKGHIKLGDTVAIFGAGPVGLSSVATMPLFGAGLIISVDVLDYRLKVAQKFGAVTINASREEPVAKIKELTGGRRVDVGIEAAGPGATVGEELSSNPDVSRVSLTGSSETGQVVMASAANSIKRLSLELGGKNPFVVLEDADIDAAI